MSFWSGRRGPRAVEGVQWRDLDDGNRDAVMVSARQSAAADGARRTDHLASLFLGMRRCLGIGGFVGEQPVAATVVRTGYRPTVEGYVHPAYRGRGLGGAMLDWALARAGSNVVVQARTLTPQAQRLFESRGLHLAAALERLWLPLDQPVETAPPPPGTALREWDTGDGFGVYAEAFADLPNNPFADSEEPGRSREDWLQWTEDSDFVAACSLLARDADGRPVGFVTCDEFGPLQVGTVPAWRRRGLGRAMVTAAIGRVRALPERAEVVEVDVSADNAAAVLFFQDSGFQRDFRAGYFDISRSVHR